MTATDADDALSIAVKAHRLALRMFGPDDERTLAARMEVKLLAPDWLLAELELAANSTIH